VPIIALTVVATVLAGYMFWQVRPDRAEAAGASAATAALPGQEAVGPATTAAAVLLSYRHDTLDAQLEDMEGYLTDDYAEQFLATFPDQVRRRLEAREVVVDTTVRAAAPMECGTACDADEAQVLLFIDKVTSAADKPEERVPNRVILSMRREEGSWLVSEIASA
jgi:Mce-associated membrane protein